MIIKILLYNSQLIILKYFKIKNLKNLFTIEIINIILINIYIIILIIILIFNNLKFFKYILIKIIFYI